MVTLGVKGFMAMLVVRYSGFVVCSRAKQKRLQNISCLAQMAQYTVAGHIAGIVQERQSSDAIQEDQAANHPTAAENPVHVEETVLPSPKPFQTPTIAESRCIQVPVELMLYSCSWFKDCLHCD